MEGPQDSWVETREQKDSSTRVIELSIMFREDSLKQNKKPDTKEIFSLKVERKRTIQGKKIPTNQNK